jgi:site-specific DNA-methyltransferase (adenine-specific)
MPELTLANGDCLDVMKEIASKSIDLIICDLPYGCLTSKNLEHEGCSWDIKIDLDAFWKEVKRIRNNDHTPIIHFCNTKFGIDLINSNPNEFRYDLVWSKSNAVGFLSANKKPMSSHEMIYIFSKAGASYKRIDIEGDFPKGGGGRSKATFLPINDLPNTGTTVEGKRCVKSVIEIANKKGKDNHPTEKPEDLYKFLIQRYCPPGGTVLDPTAGSFNSVFTAVKLGMNAIGIEKNKKFYEKGVERLNSIV